MHIWDLHFNQLFTELNSLEVKPIKNYLHFDTQNFTQLPLQPSSADLIQTTPTLNSHGTQPMTASK